MISRGAVQLDRALYDAQTEFELRVASEQYVFEYLFSPSEYERAKEGDDANKVTLIAAAFAALSPAYDASVDTMFFLGDAKIIGFVIAQAFISDSAFTSIGGGDLTRATSVQTLPPVP